jgi:hypothetical protein
VTKRCGAKWTSERTVATGTRSKVIVKTWGTCGRLKDHTGRCEPCELPHKFDEAHDDAAGCDTCWDCLRPRGDKIHGDPK